MIAKEHAPRHLREQVCKKTLAREAAIQYRVGQGTGRMQGTWDIDDATWSRLRQIVGDKLALQLVDIFLEHTPRLLVEAREAYNAGDFEPVERAGHSLKSNCGHLGALAMREAASRLEQAAAARAADSVPAMLQELEEAFALVSAHLEEKRKSATA